MAKINRMQTTFEGGMIDRVIHGRSDSALYSAAASDLQNWQVLAGGGVRRRPGTTYLADLTEEVRLEPFEFDVDEVYIMAFDDTGYTVYNTDGTVSQAHAAITGWSATIQWEFTYLQSGDFFFIAHDTIPTKEIQRTAVDTFTVSDYAFDTNDLGMSMAPFYKYADPDITIKITGSAATLTFTASSAAFNASMVGTQLKVWNYLDNSAPAYSWFSIDTYNSPTEVICSFLGPQGDYASLTDTGDTATSTTISNLADTSLLTVGMEITGTDIPAGTTIASIVDATTITISQAATGTTVGVTFTFNLITKRWLEEAISTLRGYPAAISMHAGRLYLGGFQSLPAHIAGSKTGLFWNFDTDDASADDAVIAPLDTDRINAIKHITSGRHLQIFSDLSEFHISEQEGEPITPTSFSVRRAGSFGSGAARPVVFDNSTIYVQHRDNVVREMVWKDINRAYESNPVSLVSSNLISSVKQTAVDYGGLNGPEQYVYLMNADGTLAVYHAIRSENVKGFTPWSTDGKFKSIAVVDGDLYACIERTINATTQYWLEKVTLDETMDGVINSAAGIGGVFTGVFTQYAEQLVHVTSDNNGFYYGEWTVDASGNLDLSSLYTPTNVNVGLNYIARAETLPAHIAIPSGVREPEKIRIVAAVARVVDSHRFKLDGQEFVSRRATDPIEVPASLFTGVYRVYLLGYDFDRTIVLVNDVPLSCTLLTLGMEVVF